MLCTYSNVVEIDSLHLTFQVSILCSPDCWLNKGNFFGFEMKHVLYTTWYEVVNVVSKTRAEITWQKLEFSFL